MVTGPFRWWPLTVLLLPVDAPAVAKDSRLSIEPVRGLALSLPHDRPRADLAARLTLSNPSTEGLVEPPPVTLQRDGSDLTGKRARLVVPVGDGMRLVASSGRVQRRARPGDPLAVGAGAMGRLESGKQVGAGMERRLGPLEIGAHYQFTRIRGGAIDPTGAASESSADRMMSLSGPQASMAVPDTESRHRGHSLQATARVRF